MARPSSPNSSSTSFSQTQQSVGALSFERATIAAVKRPHEKRRENYKPERVGVVPAQQRGARRFAKGQRSLDNNGAGITAPYGHTVVGSCSSLLNMIVATVMQKQAAVAISAHSA